MRTSEDKTPGSSVRQRKMRRHQGGAGGAPHQLLDSCQAGQQSNALGRVTNGSQSERRAIRFPPGGILLGRTWGSLCLMGSANPISATNALTELRAQ